MPKVREENAESRMRMEIIPGKRRRRVSESIIDPAYLLESTKKCLGGDGLE
ncbi:MAG: hypothetical protein P8J32_02230 [bacterium]|nr:hypothetical protein [bacterium]